MKKAFGQTVRDLKRGVNKKVLKEPGIKQKVLDATSNDSWGPHSSLLADIAHASRNNHEYQVAMGVLWKRLTDTGKNWRHVYKALIVLEYMIGHGPERVIDEIRERSFQILTLSDFQYIDSSGRDQGNNVRKKSQSLVALVNDKERIAEVREKIYANRDKYRNEGRYGDRNDGRSSYGGEREYCYKDDDKNSRDEDRYSKDSEDQYGRDSNMEKAHRGKSRSVDHYEDGSRGRSSDIQRSFEDDGQSSSRGGGVRVEDYSQDGRVGLQRKYSEQNIGVSPPSYEEAVSESRSPPYSERDGGETPEVAPPHLNESNNVDNQVVGVVNESPPQKVEAFDEFDPRGSVSAGVSTNVHSPSTVVSTSAPPASNNSEMDLLGSLSDVFSSNSLTTVTSDSTSFETNGQANSGLAPSFSASQSLTQPFDDPFGDSPFKAITYADTDSSEHKSFGVSNPENDHNFGKGETFSNISNPEPGFHNMQAPSDSDVFPQEQFDTSHDEIDILAGILPPSGPSITQAPQPNFAMPTSQFPHNGNMYESFHPQATPTNPNMSGQTPFDQVSQQHNMQDQTSFQASQQDNMSGHSPFGEASEQHNMSIQTPDGQASEPHKMSGQTFGHVSQQDNMSGHTPFGQASQHNMSGQTPFGQTSQQQNMMGQSSFGEASEQHNMSGQTPFGQTSQQHNMQGHTMFGQASQHYNMPEHTTFGHASQEHNIPRQTQQNNMVSPSQNLSRDVQFKNEGFMQQHTHNLSFHPSSEIIPNQPGTTTSSRSQNSHSTTPNTISGQFNGKNSFTQQAPDVSQQFNGVPSHIPHQTQSGSIPLHIYNNNGGVQFNNGSFTQHSPHYTPGMSPHHASETFPHQPASATSSSSQTPYSTTPNALRGPLDGGNSTTHQVQGASQQIHGVLSHTPHRTQSEPVAMHEYNNNSTRDMFEPIGVGSLGTSTTQPLLTPLSGAIEIVPQTQTNKKFEPKSTIWADTLSRGLVNFNISGPKTNPLADIGVDFAAINRKEKRLEKPTAAQQQQQVTSTINMGKAMGSGTGLGRAGASAMRPPPNSTVGSNMPMGMVVGGYGGMNQNHSMGMGMNMNQNYSMGMGMNMNQNHMIGMGMNMNQNQHPMGMGGMNMNMGGYGQGYPMQPQQGMSMAPGPQPDINGAYNPMMSQGGYNPQQQQPYGGGYR